MYKFLAIGLLFSGLASCVSLTNNQPTVLEGSYESVRGVKDELSCYCFNAAYLITSDDNRIPICFQEEAPAITCANIAVKGHYQKKEIANDPMSPCPAGERTIFYVASYMCK